MGSASIHELRDEFAAAGLGPAGAARVFGKLAVMVALAVACLAAGLAAPSIWAGLPLIAVGSWFFTAATMCGHDGSHKAVSKSAWVNDLLAWTAFTLLGGLSNYFWREKHNLKHHPFCNVTGRDPDVDQWPFALSREQHERSGRFFRGFQRVQPWLFLPLSFLLLSVLMRVGGTRRVVRGFVEGPHRGYAAIDMGFIALHYAGWLLPLALGAPPVAVLTLYVSTTLFAGLYLAAIFAPAHMPMPVVSSYSDPLRLQLETTRDFRTNWFFRWTLIGLDRQVEHHLAVKIPHYQLPRAVPIVRAFCARHGLPYHEAGWFRSIADTHLKLARATDLGEIVLGDPPLAPAEPVGAGVA